MALSDDGRDTLARALTSAYPDVGERLRIVAAAGLGHVQVTGEARQAWRGAIDEAIAANALERLLASGARTSRYVGLFARDVAAGHAPGTTLRRIVLLANLVWVGLVGIVFVALFAPSPFDRAADNPASVRPADPAPEPEHTRAPAPAREREPAPSPEPARAPAPPPAAATAPADVPADPECGSPDASGLLGWAYLGERSPSVDGDRLVLPTAANVRADYPRKENRWSSHAKARCWLPKGTRVRLAGEIAAIPPHDFWAPIAAVER